MSLVAVTPSSLDSYHDPDASVIALCERGSLAIEQAASVADAKDIKDWADTIEHAAKVRDLNHETIILASALKIRAERRMGQLLGPAPTPQESGARKGLPASNPLTKFERHKARRLAEPSDDEFDELLDEVSADAADRAGVSRRRVLSKIDERKRDDAEQDEWVRSLGEDPDPDATRTRGVAARAVIALTRGVDQLEKQITPAALADALASYPERQVYVRDGIVADIRRAAHVIALYEEALL